MKEVLTFLLYFMQVDYNFLEKALKKKSQSGGGRHFLLTGSSSLIVFTWLIDCVFTWPEVLSWFFPFCITDGCYPSPFLLLPLFPLCFILGCCGAQSLVLYIYYLGGPAPKTQVFKPPPSVCQQFPKLYLQSRISQNSRLTDQLPQHLV